MTSQTLVRLVKSLSGPEKKYFKTHTRQQGGKKEYMGLFDIIDKLPVSATEELKSRFQKEFPASSLDNTARYLLKVITDCLVQARTEKDTFFQLLHGIMRSRILQERSLTEEGYATLKKVRRIATDTQQHFIEYLTYRDELNHFSDSNFNAVTGPALIKTQMKAKDILKNMHHIQDHHTLFETLKYRLIHSGKIASETDKKKLNDLMLSEMILVSNKSKSSFAAQKLHLLFQSFFFTDIGDYQSALKTFNSLNKLFEQNLQLLDNPPLDYLSALNGIIESLHSLKKYSEVNYYTEKVAQLDLLIYPEYFRFLARKTIAIYTLAALTAQNDDANAKAYVSSIEHLIIQPYRMVDEEKQCELNYYCSLSCFKSKDLKKAHDYIGDMMRHHKPLIHSLVYKAMRLLNIIIYYENGDTTYLEYEIRSYKRAFNKKHPLLRSEKVLLKWIQRNAGSKRKILPESDQRKIRLEMNSIRDDKYELQLLKYFDFLHWLSIKFHLERID